jgi:hypothetical protein
MAGVPVMTPLLGFRLSPAGKPASKKRTVAPLTESVALSVSELIAVPSVPLWLLGVLSVMLPAAVIVQVNVSEEDEVPSLANTVVVNVPMSAAPEEMVPVICPVLLLMLSPPGKPFAA